MRQPTPMMPPMPQPMPGGQMGPSGRMGLQPMPQPRMDSAATNTPDMRGAIIQYLARNGFQGF